MSGIAPPHECADATNSNAARASTLAAAGFGVVPKLVIVDATHHGTPASSKDGCWASAFQAHFWLGRVRSSDRESGMSDDLRREMMSVLLDAERLMKRWSTGLEKSNPFVGRYTAGQLDRIRSLLEERVGDVLDQL